MKTAQAIERTALRAVLKFRKDGGSHQDALALTRLPAASMSALAMSPVSLAGPKPSSDRGTSVNALR